MAINTGFVNPLMAKHAEDAYLLAEGAPSGPEWAPQSGEPTRQLVKLVPTNWKSMYRTETLVQIGDVFGLISTETGAVPEMGKPIEIGGTVYQMINVAAVRYLGAAVMYKIHARA